MSFSKSGAAFSPNVLDYGATGDGVADDTAAFLAAFTRSNRVYVPAGTYLTRFGNFAGAAAIPSGTHLYGDGESSVISRYDYTPSYACIGCDSGSATECIQDIHLENLKFVGHVSTLGHNEANGHLLSLNGVKNVLIDRCYFEGPRSDAIYLGSSSGPTAERHNHNVTIRRSIFDGVVNGVDGGRNAISIIDVDGFLVDDCDFATWSRNDMPGCIDFEPNYAFGVIKRTKTVNSRFKNCAGNRGHITYAVDNIPAANFEDAQAIGNSFDGNNAVTIYSDPTIATAPQGVIVALNRAANIEYFVQKPYGSLWGLTVADNIVSGLASGQGRILLGDSGTTTWTVRDVTLRGNQLSSNVAIPLVISDNSEVVVIGENIMRGATQAHMRLGITGTSTANYNVMNNLFLGSPTNGIAQHDASTKNLGTCLFQWDTTAPSFTLQWGS